jgi:carboxymethylenebutenolidase
MGEFNTLMARDGHEFRAYLSGPQGRPNGAVVVFQEIFGVNPHIRAVADCYAQEGYLAIAPSLFDRVKKGVELGYTDQTMQEGRGYVQQLKYEDLLKDMSATVAVVKHAGRVGTVGFCWGGTMSYVAACELPIACAVAYYGAAIPKYLDKHPKCPVMYHFGEKDSSTPPEAIEKIKTAHPQGVFHTYPTGHAFNRDVDPSHYDRESAALAHRRTLEFFARYLRGEQRNN